VTLKGYLDAHTVTDFESYMDRAIEQAPAFLLDISELNYLSSAGSARSWG